MPDLIGATLGPYRITREIGRGGMAVVYEAYQPSLSRTVAIKVLPQQLTFDRDFVARFLQEARNAAQLSHPNIVPIYDVGQQDGWYYIVMQHLAGEPLNAIIMREGRLPLARATKIIEQVASALDYAHARGVIHRDIKPANIIVGPGDVATLTDFGLAKAAEAAALTRSGSIVGTPEYMSPEQAQGAPATPASDRYALGIVLYQMLAGRPPFFADTTPSLLFKQVYEPPPSLRPLAPDLPAGIDAILAMALAKKPAERYASAQEMVAALSTLRTLRWSRGKAAVRPAPARPPAPPPADPGAETRLLAAPAQPTPVAPPEEMQRRRRTWHLPALIAGIAVVLTALAFLLWPRWFASRDRIASQPAPAATSTAQMGAAATSTPIIVATGTPVKTVTQPVAPAAIPTDVPPTAMPTPTRSQQAATPTVTPRATPTSLPTAEPSQTPRPATATATPSATATQGGTQAAYPAPGLVTPADGDSASGVATFRWTWAGPPLQDNQGFEVRIWKEGQPDHYGAAAPARDNRLESDIRGAFGVQQGGAGDYFWTVALVQIDPYARIGLEAPPRKLTVQFDGGGSGPPPPPPPP